MKRIQVLNLGKHFTIIDSPVPFYLIDNYGFRAYRTAGAWQFDNWKLLPEKFHKIYPVYTLSIEWDSGENDDIQPIFMDTDLDLGDGIAGVNGQPVAISEPVTVSEIQKPVDVDLKSISLVDGFEHKNYSFPELFSKNPEKIWNFYLKVGTVNATVNNVSNVFLSNNAIVTISKDKERPDRIKIDINNGKDNPNGTGFQTCKVHGILKEIPVLTDYK